MEERRIDMELTAERVQKIKDTLLRQYCDQYEVEIVNIKEKRGLEKHNQNP